MGEKERMTEVVQEEKWNSLGTPYIIVDGGGQAVQAPC